MSMPRITREDFSAVHRKAWKQTSDFWGHSDEAFFLTQDKALDGQHHYEAARLVLEAFWAEVIKLQLEGFK